MATLISYHSSSGESGRCDARCYNAQGPDCNCICGGKNHRKGKEQAVKNTEELAQQWIDLCTQQRNLPETTKFKVMGKRV